MSTKTNSKYVLCSPKLCGPCTTTYCSTNAESKANLTYVVLVPTQLTMMPMMSLHCRITASRVQVGPKMKEGFQWVIDRAFPQVWHFDDRRAWIAQRKLYRTSVIGGKPWSSMHFAVGAKETHHGYKSPPSRSQQSQIFTINSSTTQHKSWTNWCINIYKDWSNNDAALDDQWGRGRGDADSTILIASIAGWDKTLNQDE